MACRMVAVPGRLHGRQTRCRAPAPARQLRLKALLPADLRLVAATHQTLQQMAADGRCGQGLSCRISAIPIQLPPLRQRMVDIPLRVDCLLPRGATGPRRLVVAPEALALLQAQS